MTAKSSNQATSYDLYGPVHKGLRREMAQLLERIGSTDFNDDAARAALVKELGAHINIMATHLEHEKDYIHPFIEQKVKGGSHKLEEEHKEHEKAMAELRALLSELEKAAPESRAAVGRRLYLRYGVFVGENLVHMGDEETVTQAQLHSHSSDEELMGLEGRILSSLTPDLVMGFMRSMIPAMNRDERVKLLGMMKQGAPPEAFNAVLQVAARPNLSDADWQNLTQRLGVSG